MALSLETRRVVEYRTLSAALDSMMFSGRWWSRRAHIPALGVDVMSLSSALRPAKLCKGYYQEAQRLIFLAEKVKQRLTTQTEADVQHPPRQEYRKKQFTIKRTVFERLIESEIRSRLSKVDKVLSQTSWQGESLSTLLFTGQTTRIPLIQKIVREHIITWRGGKER